MGGVFGGLKGLIDTVAPLGVQALQIDAQRDLAKAQAKANANALTRAASNQQFQMIFLGTAGLIAFGIWAKNR